MDETWFILNTDLLTCALGLKMWLYFATFGVFKSDKDASLPENYQKAPNLAESGLNSSFT
jgi:hypothetical protein